jgi:hypothetical protein
MPTIGTRKGTGPRTALGGKERSKHNALKHGIFSKIVVLEGEPQSEFNALYRGLLQHFQPVGAFEKGFVEVLAITRWRQRRLLIAEGGEIRAAQEFRECDQWRRELVGAVRHPLEESPPTLRPTQSSEPDTRPSRRAPRVSRVTSASRPRCRRSTGRAVARHARRGPRCRRLHRRACT